LEKKKKKTLQSILIFLGLVYTIYFSGNE